ncbi:hypothetical protein GP475_04945 [Corynebacterium poyangense]|uniref:Uncharacterized protein n=1 Tax=Corynebacterium poyangense TaxID=2684405 RepID=A0A7H0SND7_9CORY|nr:hypothetical protein [Corynebacterium poyangense]MBZ8177090.1 hypothetical protein [Corynebacterium poyangense]QNQ90062.1 hypothetical protein GP475_04945 [Corynebacterium poyangense]
MPRRNRRERPTGYSPLARDGARYLGVREEPGPSWARQEVFLVRPMGSHAAQKTYRCPGCENLITPGTAHIVAWPKEWAGREDDRRHWHSYCWQRR